MQPVRLMILAAGCLGVAGCAQGSDDATASYVSPLPFVAYDCRELQAKIEKLSARAKQLAVAQGRDVAESANASGKPVILLMPEVFVVPSADGQAATELAHTKPRYAALQAAYNWKKCPDQLKASASAG
jgi:hypothetical protein